jgi:hypothetical protein
MVGLGLGGGLLSIFSVATSVPLSVWLVILGVGVVAGSIRLIRHGIVPGGTGFWVAVVMLIPFLAIAASAPATMWDDFFHWLPNAAYQYRFDSLVRPSLPDPLARWPGYPQTMPFLTLAASRLDGRFLECAGPIANLLILGSFSAALASVIGECKPQPLRSSGVSGTALVGLSLAAVTLLNPGFDRNIVLSTYADAATGVAVALCGLLGCLILERVAEGRHDEARMLAWRFAFVAVTLVNLKQANTVLLGLVVAGLALVASRCPALRMSSLAGLVLVMLGPSVTVWLVWRVYVILILPGGEMSFRSPWQWNWLQFPEMLSSIWDVYRENPVFYAAMTGITIAGVAVLKHPTTAFRRLLAVTAISWIGYNAFLVLVYLGAMNSDEAAMGADYWRYMPHLGLLGTLAVAVGIVNAPRPVWIAEPLRVAAMVSVVAFPLAVIWNAEVLSPLSKIWPLHFRQVGHELAENLPGGARVVVICGKFTDPMPFAIRYDLWRPGREDRDLRVVFEGETPDLLKDIFRTGRATHLLLTGALINMDWMTEPLQLRAVDNETTLFSWDGDEWLETRSWPVAPALKPERAPSEQPEHGPDPQIGDRASD